MTRERLQLALERLTATTWRRLETFASEFLAPDFPNLRTTASPSGDGGRDAEIINFADDPVHVLQYSVAEDWNAKIRITVKRLNQTNPQVQLLTYVTNHTIGADADELKREVKTNHRIFLDVRDSNYFLDRFHQSLGTERAAEALAVDLVDPLLAKAKVIRQATAVLTSEEAKAALLLLSLQLKDDTQEKGLTKLSFEALVHSVLMDTDAEHRMKRTAILEKVRALVPHDASHHVDELATSALKRLTKRVIRHYPSVDEYCLTHDESVRVKAYQESLAVDELELQSEIGAVVKTALASEGTDDEVRSLAIRVRRILERCLYDRAELFASVVLSGNMSSFSTDRIQEVVMADQTETVPSKGGREADPDFIKSIIEDILIGESQRISEYLAHLSNAYTLMAFLKSTPDVQNAIKKIFSHGEIFLDTTVLLPLLAEEILPGKDGHLQRIISIATDAGIQFFVTEGVLEELASHLNRGLAYARGTYTSWEGGIPFIFEAYVRAGADPRNFRMWVEEFMGDTRPVEDLGLFLEKRFNISAASLEKDMLEAPEELRYAVDQIWADIHEKRREGPGKVSNIDPLTIIRLAKHDTENYVGVIQRRKAEVASPMGYSVWWLTFDKLALRVGELLRAKHGIKPPASPILSLDFLSQCLAIGPIRAKLSKKAAQSIPIMMEPRAVSFLTKDLLDEAQKIRKEMEGRSEYVIARRVRDHLDSARQRMGFLAQKGVDTFYDELPNLTS